MISKTHIRPPDLHLHTVCAMIDATCSWCKTCSGGMSAAQVITRVIPAEGAAYPLRWGVCVITAVSDVHQKSSCGSRRGSVPSGTVNQPDL